MTDFVHWWDDHSPLIPAVIVWTAALAYIVWWCYTERRWRKRAELR